MSTTNTKDKASKAKTTTVPAEIHKAEVVKEVSLEQQINNKLAENNITRKVLNALKDKYLTEDKTALKPDFILKDKTDKETYLIIKKERLGVRKIGVLTESVCKKGREDAIQIQKQWLSREKDTLIEVGTVQDKLDEQIKIFEDEQARIEKEESERKDNQFNIRQTQLIKMGAVPANGCLNLNETSIETSLIREADEEDYKETILPLLQRQYEKNQAAQIAEQKKKDDEALLLKQQQDALAEEQRKFREEQEQFKQQQAELQKQRDEVVRQEKEKKESALKAKCVRLEALGMRYSYQTDEYSFDIVSANKSGLLDMSDVDFENLLQGISAHIAERKQILFKQQEEKREHELEAAKQKAIREEQERAAEEKKQAEIKAQQDEVRRLEEAAKATDKEKWASLIESLSSIALPEFKSTVYKSKANQLAAKINEIKAL